MNHDEKVIFLFTQTCSILTGKAPTNSHIGEMRHQIRGAYDGLGNDFDHVYSILEEKLKQKLQG